MILVAVLLAAAGAWTHANAQAAPPSFTAQQLRGGGSWKPDGKAAVARQQWRVDAARRTDNSLRGRVTLGGSPLAQAGNLLVRISGQSLSGNVVDDSGKQIASFTGTITAAGISGTYTDRTGETGNWTRDGPLPK
jgi:hypothetical protein